MTQKNAVVSSVSVPSTSAGSAGNLATAVKGVSGTLASSVVTATAGAAVVAPKGFRLELSQMLAGWKTVIPTGAAVPSRGGTLPQATVLAQLEGFMGDYTSIDSATLALKAARTQAKSDLAAAKALLVVLKEALTSFLGATNPQLAAFGMKPKGERKAVTVQKLAVKVAKAENTRAIRGTMGKVQRADLGKSGPMTVTVTPAPSPVAPVASAVSSAAASGTPPAAGK